MISSKVGPTRAALELSCHLSIPLRCTHSKRRGATFRIDTESIMVPTLQHLKLEMNTSASEKQESVEGPNYIEIAGQRMELSGISGQSTVPQASATAPIRADLTIAGQRIELSEYFWSKHSASSKRNGSDSCRSNYSGTKNRAEQYLLVKAQCLKQAQRLRFVPI